jgi:hypothetical protein
VHDVYDADPVGLLAREVLRERLAALVAEACAWCVGLSDTPHHVRRHGRVQASGVTLGDRAAGGLALGSEEDARLELGEAREGTFADVLNALTPDGRLLAERFEVDVLAPFVTDTCVRAAQRVRDTDPASWQDLLDDLGEDDDDLLAVVRAAEWEAPLRIEAENLLLAALGGAPLVEVEAEGLPLSLVRAAEAQTRAAAPQELPDVAAGDDDTAAALFLAEVALRSAELPVPVPAEQAGVLLDALLEQGLEPEEVLAVLPHLPVRADTAERVDDVLRRLDEHGWPGGRG